MAVNDDDVTSDEQDSASYEQSHETPDQPIKQAPDEGKTIKDFFSLDEIFQRVLATADEELAKSNQLLFWSGLAAGLSLGLTFLARVTFGSLLPGDSAGLLSNLFYPLGFLIVAIGRYQLFTENTLTPVALVATRLASLKNLLRLWGIVFIANLMGALVVAAMLAFTAVLEPAAVEVAIALGEHVLTVGWGALFAKAVFAGWLVASMVWLVHGTRDTISKILIVWLIMYFVGVANLYHCIPGSLEAFYAAFKGEANFLAIWPNFILPVTLGNIVGGVVFVAVLNYMQFGNDKSRFATQGQRLSWREWLLGKTS